MQWTTAGASGGGKCVGCAPRPREIKGDPRAKGIEPLGKLGKRTEKDGVQKGTTTQIYSNRRDSLNGWERRNFR